MRILLAEDDVRLSETVTAYLRRAGFAVDPVTTARAAEVEAAVTSYDVIILDLNLPDGDGVELCRRLRARGIGARILMATARDAVRDRVSGLESGADDYLVKPYALEELRERVRALLRRPPAVMPEVLRAGDLTLDTATRIAARGTRTIPLTTKEFAVLEYLMRNTGRVITRDQISEHAWDANYDPASNIIDVYIGRLRRKIDGPGDDPLVETIRGAGYRLGAGGS